jgi:hypothetical protein
MGIVLSVASRYAGMPRDIILLHKQRVMHLFALNIKKHSKLMQVIIIFLSILGCQCMSPLNALRCPSPIKTFILQSTWDLQIYIAHFQDMLLRLGHIIPRGLSKNLKQSECWGDIIGINRQHSYLLLQEIRLHISESRFSGTTIIMGMFVLLPNSANALAVFPAEASTSVVD